MPPAKLSLSTKAFPSFRFTRLRLLIVLAVILGSAASSSQTFGQTPGQTLVFPTSIQWNKQGGVVWYRLQIGRDETFRNIFYDRRVFSGRFTVSNLPPGYYYWRIAPADERLGIFSRPVRFFVSGGVVTPIETSRQYLEREAAFWRPIENRRSEGLLGAVKYVGG
jgi:hypothetical protein